MSEQLRSTKQELAHIAELMASTEAAIIDAADPFPWQVSLDGLRVRRLRLTEKLAAELEAELAVRDLALDDAIEYGFDYDFGAKAEFIERARRKITEAREESQCEQS